MGGVFLSPTRANAQLQHAPDVGQPGTIRPVKPHSLRRPYEDEFRTKMFEAGLPWTNRRNAGNVKYFFVEKERSWPRSHRCRVDQINYSTPPNPGWTCRPVFNPAISAIPAKPDILKYLNFPNPRKLVAETDRRLEAARELEGDHHRGVPGSAWKMYRSFKVFMDICVRCGACADKCHFFIGGGDHKNMPVLRAELLRSIYRGDFNHGRQGPGPPGRGAQARDRRGKGMVPVFYQCRNAPLLAFLPPTASTPRISP
jgi:hypothetical protein